jgi:hypothetical protein
MKDLPAVVAERGARRLSVASQRTTIDPSSTVRLL